MQQPISFCFRDMLNLNFIIKIILIALDYEHETWFFSKNMHTNKKSTCTHILSGRKMWTTHCSSRKRGKSRTNDNWTLNNNRTDGQKKSLLWKLGISWKYITVPLMRNTEAGTNMFTIDSRICSLQFMADNLIIVNAPVVILSQCTSLFRVATTPTPNTFKQRVCSVQHFFLSSLSTTQTETNPNGGQNRHRGKTVTTSENHGDAPETVRNLQKRSNIRDSQAVVTP